MCLYNIIVNVRVERVTSDFNYTVYTYIIDQIFRTLFIAPRVLHLGVLDYAWTVASSGTVIIYLCIKNVEFNVTAETFRYFI